MKKLLVILFLFTVITSNVEAQTSNKSISELESQKKEALANENYELASELKKKIEIRKENLNSELKIALEQEDYKRASSIKKELNLESTPSNYNSANQQNTTQEYNTETYSDSGNSKYAESEFFDGGFQMDFLLGVTSYVGYENDWSTGDEFHLPYVTTGFGIGARIANKWYFGSGNMYKPGLQVTWVKLGFYINPDGIIIQATPLNVGFANSVAFNENMGIEANLHMGLAIAVGGGLEGDLGFSYNPSIKFRYNKLAFGIDYLRANLSVLGTEYNSSLSTFSLTFGLRI